MHVRFTNGVGNNIFQYVFGRLLAEERGYQLCSGALDVASIPSTQSHTCPRIWVQTIGLHESNWLQYFDRPLARHVVVHTYPEDFRIYKPHLARIRGWFGEVQSRADDDLVFHLRLGDRLLRKNTYASRGFVSARQFMQAIQHFSFDRLHIVTDMPVWRRLEVSDLDGMRFHATIPRHRRVSLENATNYFNEVFETLNGLDPIVRAGQSVKEDFAYMRGFKKILLQHGTLSWWAAALSDADEVAVYGPWRPFNGDRNRNLGETDLPGWYQWGWPEARRR